MVYPLYDPNDPAHNSALKADGGRSERSLLRFGSNHAPRSPTKSTSPKERSLSRSPDRNRSRLQGLADSIRSKANLFYDPSIVNNEEHTSPKSQTSRKSARFRGCLSISGADIQHSSPIAIPMDEPPILPDMNFSNSALIDIEGGPLPPIIQTARPSPTLVLGQTSTSLSGAADLHLNASPAKSFLSNADSIGLPTPMPGTNLPLDDPFDDVHVLASSQSVDNNVDFPQHLTLPVSGDGLHDIQPLANEDTGYASDEESNAELLGPGKHIHKATMPSSLCEPANLEEFRCGVSHDDPRPSLRRTRHLPHGLNDLSSSAQFLRPELMQIVNGMPSERYDADVSSSEFDSASDLDRKWTVSQTELVCKKTRAPLTNAPMDMDESGSELELKIANNLRKHSLEQTSHASDLSIENEGDELVGTSGVARVSSAVPTVWYDHLARTQPSEQTEFKKENLEPNVTSAHCDEKDYHIESAPSTQIIESVQRREPGFFELKEKLGKEDVSETLSYLITYVLIIRSSQLRVINDLHQGKCPPS